MQYNFPTSWLLSCLERRCQQSFYNADYSRVFIITLLYREAIYSLGRKFQVEANYSNTVFWDYLPLFAMLYSPRMEKYIVYGKSYLDLKYIDALTGETEEGIPFDRVTIIRTLANISIMYFLLHQLKTLCITIGRCERTLRNTSI